ncbi:MAG: double zinc ribbon domain-containing protein [Methanobacteriaceae archaeon]
MDNSDNGKIGNINKTTKFCTNCGAGIDAKAEICPKCGEKVLISPPNPSKIQNSNETKFCTNCGAKIDTKAEICPKCGVRNTLLKVSTEKKNPGLAALLSALVMGLGQIYNGKLGRGLVFLISGIILGAIEGLVSSYLSYINYNNSLYYYSYSYSYYSPYYRSYTDPTLYTILFFIILIIIISVWAYGVYDAYKIAKKINCGEIE